jgi:hypothetical protein
MSVSGVDDRQTTIRVNRSLPCKGMRPRGRTSIGGGAIQAAQKSKLSFSSMTRAFQATEISWSFCSRQTRARSLMCLSLALNQCCIGRTRSRRPQKRLAPATVSPVHSPPQEIVATDCCDGQCPTARELAIRHGLGFGRNDHLNLYAAFGKTRLSGKDPLTARSLTRFLFGVRMIISPPTRTESARAKLWW